MKARIVLLSASLILAYPSILAPTVAAQVRQSWVAQYSTGDTIRDWASSMAFDAAGDVYVTGSTRNSNTLYRFSEYLTVKFASDGGCAGPCDIGEQPMDTTTPVCCV